MITGRPPVPDGTAARKLHHHQHVKPIDPRELVPGLPDDVALLLDRMMAKDPAKRPDSARALAEALEQIAASVWSASDAEAWWQAHAPGGSTATPPCRFPGSAVSAPMESADGTILSPAAK